MSSPAPTPTTTTTAAATTAATTTTTKTAKTTQIKAVTAFSTMPDPPLAILGGTVAKGMTGNTAFPDPPVDPTDLSTLVTGYTASIQAALDGGANAKAVCEKDRKLVIQDLKLLAIYVQNNCNDDLSIFTTSGFTAQTPTSTAGQPAAVPTIRTLDYGTNSGQITVTLRKAAGAVAYFLRYAVMTNGAPGAWSTVGVANAGKKVTVPGLTPGSTYAFQVQALGSTGYTDWSDSSTIMCV